MPTQKYRLKDGTIVPGTTTIIGRSLGWSKDALMYWAWQQGQEGLDFRDTSARAADAGTLAHALAEADITGNKQVSAVPPSPETYEKAISAFQTYETWKKMTKLSLRSSEIPLVSEAHRYGGTIDAIGEIDGKYVLVDFKTSNGIYADHIIQVAAYSKLWEVNNPDKPLLGGVHILRFSKGGGHFHHHYYPTETITGRPWAAFLLLRQLWDLRKPIEEMT